MKFGSWLIPGLSTVLVSGVELVLGFILSGDVTTSDMSLEWEGAGKGG